MHPQLISELTNFELDKNHSCSDIVITDNLLLDSENPASPNSFCRHQIAYCKVTFIKPPPPPFEDLRSLHPELTSSF